MTLIPILWSLGPTSACLYVPPLTPTIRYLSVDHWAPLFQIVNWTGLLSWLIIRVFNKTTAILIVKLCLALMFWSKLRVHQIFWLSMCRCKVVVQKSSPSVLHSQYPGISYSCSKPLQQQNRLCRSRRFETRILFWSVGPRSMNPSICEHMSSNDQQTLGPMVKISVIGA